MQQKHDYSISCTAKKQLQQFICEVYSCPRRSITSPGFITSGLLVAIVAEMVANNYGRSDDAPNNTNVIFVQHGRSYSDVCTECDVDWRVAVLQIAYINCPSSSSTAFKCSEICTATKEHICVQKQKLNVLQLFQSPGECWTEWRGREGRVAVALVCGNMSIKFDHFEIKRSHYSKCCE
jgi:hypothetical protein